MNALKTHFIALVASSALIVALLVLSTRQHPLLPAAQSQFPYVLSQSSDALEGGSSRVELMNTEGPLSYRFQLKEGFEYPYASIGLGFLDILVDWGDYQELKLSVQCSPANTLLFSLLTYDTRVTQTEDYSSHRPATSKFSCSEDETEITVDLAHLTTPDWWLMRFDLPLADNNYSLNKVFGISVANSSQSPRHVESEVQIKQVTIVGRDWRFILAAALVACLQCALIIRWWLGWQAQKIKDQIRPATEASSEPQDYQLTSIDSKRERDRDAVLAFMATQYANPELSLEFATRSLGINRMKINAILREHCGRTFSTQLNKLRLTEAARLLREKDASVSEIGFSVGYNNASYFIRSFKKEFGCTPNAYKKQTKDGLSDSESNIHF